jgi:hypothetical protein
MPAFAKITVGQILLIICCIFYLVFWSISYKPDQTVNRGAGLSGLFLLITAVCGITGVFFSVQGVNSITPHVAAKLNGTLLIAGGVIAYILLLLITTRFFKRPVTTELLLIVSWMVLELTVISTLNAGGRLSDLRFWIMLVIIEAAFILSMVLYVLYYRMEPMKAYYAAMIPLITEGISMAVLVGMMLV